MKELNKHVLLAMKWLNDKSSVTKAELKENRRAANADAYAADVAAYATAYAATTATATTEEWVNKYFDRSGEDKSLYTAALLLAEEEKREAFHLKALEVYKPRMSCNEFATALYEAGFAEPKAEK